jgi:hypothetical protein
VSAPTLLDELALQRHLAQLPVLTRPARSGADLVENRRCGGAIPQLTREHDELCTQAVDPLEIAAGLEAAGVNDRAARRDYAAGNVFELAQRMFALVPRRPADLPRLDDPWRAPARRHLLRGVLYALPGLLFLAALQSLRPAPAGLALLLGASVAANAASQALSLLGHLLIGRGDLRAARRLVVTVLLTCAASPLVAYLGCAACPRLRPAALMACAQVSYVLAATVLLVLRADRWLLAVLVPGAVLGGAGLTGRLAVLSGPVLLATGGACVMAAVVTAGVQVLRSTRGRSFRRWAIGPAELVSAAGHALAGGLASCLLAFVPLDSLTRPQPGDGAAVMASMLPVVLALGVGEWLVHLLRSRGRTATYRVREAPAFRRWAARAVLTAGLVQLVVLALLAGLVLGVTGAVAAVGPVLLLDTVGYALLGVGLLLAALLLSLGRPRPVLVVAATTLVADLVLRGMSSGAPLHLLAARHALLFGLFLLAMFVVTTAEFRRPSLHR